MRTVGHFLEPPEVQEDEELRDCTAEAGSREVFPVEVVGSPEVEELFDEAGEERGDDAGFHAECDAEEGGDEGACGEVPFLVGGEGQEPVDDGVPDFADKVFHGLVLIKGLNVDMFYADFDVFLSSFDDSLDDVGFVDFVVIESVFLLEDIAEGFTGVVEVGLSV